MQLLGMMLGGVVGLLFFGAHSWGFYASVFIGALAGAALRHNTDSAPPPFDRDQYPVGATPETVSPPPVPDVVSVTEPVPSPPRGPVSAGNGSVVFRSVLVAVVLLALASAYWFANRESPPKKPVVAEAVKARPIITASIWDQRHCLRTSFPQSQFMAVPPEVDMYCAHPWNKATMKKLRDALQRANLGVVDVLPGHPEIAAMIESIPDKELRDFALLERLLPIAKADEATVIKSLKNLLPPATLQKIRVFKANVPWNDDPTENGLKRYHLSNRVTLVTDQFDIKSVAELADAIFIRITAQTAINTAMGGNAVGMLDWRGILASADAFATLMYLQFNIIAETKFANAPPYATAWSKPHHDHEIYFTDALPDWPCSGQSLAGRRAALLCPQDRRLFVSVAPLEAVGDIYAELGGKPIFKLPPAFFHELAHMLRDPVNARSQPFMTEGRATAEGERSLQIFKAAVSKANDKASVDDMQKFFKGIGDPNYQGPDKSSVVAVDQTINDQPFTVFQTAAVCHVAGAPPDATYLIRQLEMPDAFFNDQARDKLRHAYYVAWSLFHYGDEKPGLQYGGDRLDAGIIRQVADLVAQNRPVEGQNLIALNTYLTKVQQLASTDIKRKNISCPRSGGPQSKSQGG